MISSGEKKRQVRKIRMQYEELSQKWGYNLKELLGRFEKRFGEATKSKVDMGIFFQAENEAIKIFEENMKDEDGNSEAEDTEAVYATTLGEETGDNVGKDKQVKRSAFEGNYNNYNRIKIHENASAEMEHLFGAMVAYRSTSIAALEESRKVIRDKVYQTMIYEIENLLNELGDYQSGRLPTVFSVYKVKVERARGLGELERARMEPFKATVNIVRKIKRLERWVENHHSKLPPHIRLMYDDKDCSLRGFAEHLARNIQAVVKNFGLQEFLDN